MWSGAGVLAFRLYESFSQTFLLIFRDIHLRIILLSTHTAIIDTFIHTASRPFVMGYETSKLITSDTDLEKGNAQRERRKIATTC